MATRPVAVALLAGSLGTARRAATSEGRKGWNSSMTMSRLYLGATMVRGTLTRVVKQVHWSIDRGLCRLVPIQPLRDRLARYCNIDQDFARLAEVLRVDVADIPPTGGPAASPDFLLLLARAVLTERPETVVEFGSGTSSFVIARCLEINGTGSLLSFDHSPGFAELTRRQLARRNLFPTIEVVPLRAPSSPAHCGMWYAADDLPDRIDMIVVDGPPASLHPETRGGAGPATFARLRDGGVVFLDDARRDGERRVVANWRKEHPEIDFTHADTVKGTVVGRKTVTAELRLEAEPSEFVALRGEVSSAAEGAVFA